MPACQSKSTNLYMYIDEFDTFYSCLPRVCYKKNLFWHNRGVPKNKTKLKAAPKLSRELFVPGLFIVEIKTHAFVQWVLQNICEMSMMS